MTSLADRIKDTTISVGTGAITLANSAPLGYRTFAVGFGSSSVLVSYCISSTATGEWEIGRGTFNGTTGLTREVVRSSSNSNSLVNFSAGSKDVFVTASSELLDNSNIGLQYAARRGFFLP